MPGDESTGRGAVVLLGGSDHTTDIVAHYLAGHVQAPTVIMEQPPSRVHMAVRRARRVGWSSVAGQILFVTLAQPVLRRRGRQRIRTIIGDSGLDDSPYPGPVHVDSVNDRRTIDLLQGIGPTAIVVSGTRIISRAVLDAVECPFINIHAGITPRYRGAHGGYWALADGRPDLVGTTIHLVDQGIDTGGVLARAFFEVTPADTVATYPYLHLAAGLPLLADQVGRILSGGSPSVLPDDPDIGRAPLRLHPTLWEYLHRRTTEGVG